MVRKFLAWLIVLAIAAPILVLIAWWLLEAGEAEDDRGSAGPVAVEVAPIERGIIRDERTFSGTLLPRAQFIVAPKVPGRVVSLRAQIGDAVATGEVVAELDDAEFVQAVAQAQAEVQVTQATLGQARSALEIAQREHERIRTLRERDIASESALDVAEADLRGKQAQVEVAQAQVHRAEAALAAQQVRLGYTDVAATWTGSDEPRIVSERYVDEGATVAANDPIVTISDLSSVHAVLFVTERDYGRLAVGQPVTLQTDAFPGETFAGKVLRLAPTFEETSRQARVEIEVPNPQRRLKPGMYVRADVVLEEAHDAVVVPAAAVVRRGGGEGIFVVADGADTVRWSPITRGITAHDRVQLRDATVAGRVVTLGQQLLDEGSTIRIVQRDGEPAAP